MISLDDAESIPKNATVVDIENFYEYFVMPINHYQKTLEKIDIIDFV